MSSFTAYFVGFQNTHYNALYQQEPNSSLLIKVFLRPLRHEYRSSSLALRTLPSSLVLMQQRRKHRLWDLTDQNKNPHPLSSIAQISSPLWTCASSSIKQFKRFLLVSNNSWAFSKCSVKVNPLHFLCPSYLCSSVLSLTIDSRLGRVTRRKMRFLSKAQKIIRNGSHLKAMLCWTSLYIQSNKAKRAPRHWELGF